MKILDFGSLNIDFVYQVDHIILPGETLSGGEVQQFAGGKGANQSVALSKAGADVYLAGKIGAEGKWLIEKLNNYGVNTDFVRIYNGPSGHTIIQVTPEGENSIILSGGGNRQIQDEEIEETLSFFGKGDFLLLQNEINGTESIMRKAHDRGMKICINPAPFDKSVLAWPLELVDLFILNEHEAAGMAGVSVPADDRGFFTIMDSLTAKFPHAEIIMTLGEKGSLYGKGDERVSRQITSVKAVDTTAAGDTYMGYFLASRIEGIAPVDSMIRASRASAITVSRPGAMDSIPLVSELS